MGRIKALLLLLQWQWRRLAAAACMRLFLLKTWW
jgi:hypothetical protein